MQKEPQVLDINAKQDVKYAVPIFVRDHNIAYAIAHVKGRIQPVYEKRNEPCAIVCFGPSLNDTWEQIRNFGTVFTCSGSHRFLIDRGIIPFAHVEVDPRAHKVQLLGEPHPDVLYLPASTCAPAYFDHLLKHEANIKLWHVFDNDAEALRVLPPGEWALTGGSSVGLRAMTIAHFFGFSDLHIFGMDGHEGASGKHAAAHPMQPKGYALTEYKGVTYKTTPSLLSCAKQTFHELDMMPEVKATFYGEGLVQAMAKDYVPKPAPKGTPLVGFCKPLLITPEYAELNRKLHVENMAYGVGGERHAQTVLKLCESLQTKNALDYGSGKGRLARALPFQIAEYDPAVPGKETQPKPADLVCALDVLEHIEPACIDAVMDDIRRCTRKLLFAVIHTGPSTKFLADGRNAHILQRDCAWWLEKVGQYLHVHKIWQAGPLVYMVAGPRIKKKKATAA